MSCVPVNRAVDGRNARRAAFLALLFSTYMFEYMVTLTAFFFPLALVNIVRFSIQGMGYSTFAILAGVLEMAARTVVGLCLVPLFGFTAACFASPAAWICADLFLIPASMACIARLRKLYPSVTDEVLELQKNPI